MIRTFLVCGVVSALTGLGALGQQLNQNCIVSVLNRNTQVNADGTWVLPNIPAGFGSVRARATCVSSGVTTSGQSDLFSIVANRMNAIPPIILGSTTPIPSSLTITAPTTSLTTTGQTSQLTVTASYSGSPNRNVTAASAGTVYRTTNAAIASVSADGLVTAGSATGTAIVQAALEGTQGIISFQFVPGEVPPSGIPDSWAIANGLDPNDPTMPVQDPDHDGLTNLQEFQAGTDPHNADSDGDGLSDGDEVHGTHIVNGVETNPNHYVTNPLLADTDGDGINDLTEILTGSDPTNPASRNLHAALTSITVAPATFTLIVNSISGIASAQLTVTGHLIDNHTIDLTSTGRGTNYQSSNLNVCNFGSPDGRVFAGSAGPCTITVSNNGFTATASGAVTNFTPLSLSYVAVPGFANAVAVSGDYAYVAAGASGLQVVSLSNDRTHPAIAGSLSLAGNAYDVNLVGNTAYVAGSTSLHVVDITTPTAPVLRGSFSTGSCLGAVVTGTTAYLNCSSGLLLVNIANPAAMIQISSLSVGGEAWKLAVDPARNLVAMARGSSGLKLVDVTNSATPVLKGTASTGDARAVALSGNWAFVADYTTSTNSVDIASLTAPVVVSHIADSANLGGYLQDIALSGSFALGADVKFFNGVPITDISNPASLQARAILNFTQRDDNHQGIAVDSGFVYVATEHNSLTRGGSTGDSRLYIGQFLPRQDLAGVPPTASIASPASGSTQYQGAQLTVTVNATDDVAVATVDFLVSGQVAFTATTSPYQYTFTVPVGISSLTLGARATDLGGNVGTAQNVTVNVVPDPLTLVTGLVVDANNAPISGVTVTAPGGATAVTGADGRFSIASVPTVAGAIIVTATYTPAGGSTLTGASASTPPVRGGTTDVGTISLIPASFETNYGTLISRCDDCSYLRTLPFAFPFYGTNRTTAYVGTNGYITFNQGDSTYTESLPAFNSLPRISAFFDDLYGGRSADPAAGLYVNDQLAGRFIVTYLRNPHFSAGGSFTLQLQLYQDGRIVFAYQGMTPLNTGNIVGVTPGPNSPSQAIDYSVQRSADVPAGTAVYEYFTSANLFDLDQAFVIFTPSASGGYGVRTLLPAGAAHNSIVTGGVDAGGAVQGIAAGAPLGLSPRQRSLASAAVNVAGAEVIVTSSTDLSYRGMTNTDAQGNFVLGRVPAGGISVVVWRNGRIIAQGCGVFPGGSLAPQTMNIVLTAPPAVVEKTAPQTDQ